MVPTRNTRLAALLTAGLFLSPWSQADVILGGTVEVARWAAELDGKARNGGNTIDVNDDLGFDDDNFNFFVASFEHTIPVLPNIRVESIKLEQAENGTLSANFDGLSASTDVRTTLDLSHMDLTLYYEVLDNWVTIDLGLTAKKFDGELAIRQQGGSGESFTEIDETIPLLYAAAEVELPLSGLSAGIDISGVRYSDNSLYDARVRLRQDISLAFVELGYRSLAAKIEDLDETEVDIDLSGIYFSLGLDF